MSFFKRIFSLGKDEIYEEAMRLFNQHNYREAIEKFEEILKKKTSSKSLHHNLSRVYISQSHRNIGIILFTMGNYSGALQEFNMALEYNPDFHELNYFIGVCKNNLGEFDGAIENFNAVLDSDPSNLPARLKLGIALHNYKMWEKAINLYKNILLTNPNYADIHYNLGLAYLGQGKVNEAIAAFEGALRINTDYLQARVKIAIAQIYLGNFDKALEILIPLVEKYPNYADIHYYMGVVHAVKNEFKDAIESFKRALEIHPAYKDAKVKMGALYCYFEKFDEGIKELEDVSRIDPGDEDITMITNAIKNALATSSYSGETFREIFNKVFFKDKQITKAIPEFNKCLEISPDISEMISVIMGIAEEDRSLCEMLIPYVKDHVAENADYPDLHNSLGTLYMKIKRLEEAEVSFRTAVELNPQFLKARLNLFHTLKLLKKYEDAINEGEYILAHNVTYPDFHCVMAEIYEGMADHDKALKSVFRSLEMNRNYARANFLAGVIYGKIGEKDRAIEYYNKCLESKPTEDLSVMTKEELQKLEAE